MNHKTIILTHLRRKGSISQAVASTYGVNRLADVVWKLRRKGLPIKSTVKYDGRGVGFVAYRLGKA